MKTGKKMEKRIWLRYLACLILVGLAAAGAAFLPEAFASYRDAKSRREISPLERIEIEGIVREELTKSEKLQLIGRYSAFDWIDRYGYPALVAKGMYEKYIRGEIKGVGLVAQGYGKGLSEEGAEAALAGFSWLASSGAFPDLGGPVEELEIYGELYLMIDIDDPVSNFPVWRIVLADAENGVSVELTADYESYEIYSWKFYNRRFGFENGSEQAAAFARAAAEYWGLDAPEYLGAEALSDGTDIPWPSYGRTYRFALGESIGIAVISAYNEGAIILTPFALEENSAAPAG